MDLTCTHSNFCCIANSFKEKLFQVFELTQCQLNHALTREPCLCLLCLKCMCEWKCEDCLFLCCFFCCYGYCTDSFSGQWGSPSTLFRIGCPLPLGWSLAFTHVYIFSFSGMSEMFYIILSFLYIFSVIIIHYHK